MPALRFPIRILAVFIFTIHSLSLSAQDLEGHTTEGDEITPMYENLLEKKQQEQNKSDDESLTTADTENAEAIPSTETKVMIETPKEKLKPLTSEEMQNRLLDLESQVKQLQQNSGFLSQNQKFQILLGGDFSFQLSHVSPISENEVSFHHTEFNLHTHVDFKNQWQGFAETQLLRKQELNNPHDTTRSWGAPQEQVHLKQAWLKYQYQDQWNFKMGWIYTAFTNVSQHFSKPRQLFTQTPSYLAANTSPFVSSLQGLSIDYTMSDFLSLELYGGSHPVIKSPFVYGAQIRFHTAMVADWELGLSAQEGTHQNETKKYHVYGVHLLGHWEDLSFQGEFMTDESHHVAYAVQPSVGWSSFVFFYRLEKNDENTKIITNEDHSQQSGGFNYLISPEMRFKMDYTLYSYKVPLNTSGKKKEYHQVAVELSFSF